MHGTTGARVRTMRDQRAWTLEDLACFSGVSARQLQRIEAGISVPQPGTLAKIAAAFGTDAARLLHGHDGETLARIADANTCGACGAQLLERVYVPHEYGDAELETFACGSSRGWRDRPCPSDPRFPRFEDYDLAFYADDDGERWMCVARGLTDAARAVELSPATAASRDKAARWVERSYVQARDGHEVAERLHPFAELM
jgi:transcriptional regulator with XRE-family HTH domain